MDLPRCSDLFDRRGTCALRGLGLPEPHRLQLDRNLRSLVEFQAKIAPIKKQLGGRPRNKLCVRGLGKLPGKSYETCRAFMDTRQPEVIANIALSLLHQANHLLDRQIRNLEKSFLQ